MRNFKLLLTALLLTLVWGFSFSSALVVEQNFYNSNYIKWINYQASSTLSQNYIYLNSANNLYTWICFQAEYDIWNLQDRSVWVRLSTSSFNQNNWMMVYFWRDFLDISPYYFVCLDTKFDRGAELYFNTNLQYDFTVKRFYLSDYLSFLNSYQNCPSCSSCESSLNQCQSDLSSCTNSCDTLVSQCQSDKETLQLSYSGCIETNSSLQNYNDSLALQLQECIEQWSWFSGATIINLYDMFRSDWINDYSLPITNNIKLPYWYRGFLDDWVLAIKNIYTLENAYSFDDDSFQNWVIENFWKVFLFFMSCGLTLVFLYAIRRYFIWLKSIK